MSNKGLSASVNLKASLNVDTVSADVKVLGDPSADVNANTGIEREGGVRNIYQTEELFSDPGYYFETENGLQLSAITSGANRVIKVDGVAVGQVSAYGVEFRADVLGVDDIALTADGTYLTVKLSGVIITLSEYSFAGVLLHSRDITFTPLATLAQFFTSLGFVRYDSMHYVDSQEFVLRLGDQVVILKESSPSTPIPASLSSSTVLGQGNAIYAVVVFGSYLIVAGANGRLGSFDGGAWRNYDGSGLGAGPFNNGTVIGTSDIHALALFGTGFAVGGSGGRLGSWDGTAWKNYDATGTGTGVRDNATLIGANQINVMAVWTNYLIVGGVGGRIGSTDGTNYRVYTQADVDFPTSNAAAVGANDVLSMAVYTGSTGDTAVIVGASGGRVASWDGGGWIYYNATKLPATAAATWTLRTHPSVTGGLTGAVYGNGLWVVVATNTTTSAVMTSPDGITWTARTNPAAAVGWVSVAFGNGVFVAVAQTTSTTQAVMTSPDGITWTSRTNPAGGGSGWTTVTFGNSLFVAVAGSTSANTGVMTSSDGITWTLRNHPAAAGPAGWHGVAFGAGVFVAVARNTSTTQAIMTSPDGVTWTARTNPAGGGSGWEFVAFGNSLFVAVALTTSTTQAIITSPDGITWTARTNPAATTGWIGVTYGGTVWVAVDNTLGTSAVITSPDGVTWTSRTTPALVGALSGWRCVAYGNGLFIGVGTSNTATQEIMTARATSLYSISNNSTAISTDNVTALFAETSRIIIGGHLGKVASYNGTTWDNYNSGSAYTNNAVVVGASQINVIVKFGTTYVVASATGLVGSYDGTNWKNYDGTGTGTGVYNNATVVGANSITAGAVLGSLLYLAAVVGYVTTMTSAGAFPPFYTTATGIVANLLTGQTTLGAVYCFRYQSNGQYFLNIPGNNLNNAYVLDGTTLALVVLFCSFAFAQTSGGYTRHVLTEVPRTSTTFLYIVSLTGFVSFTLASYTTGQTYDNAAYGSNVSSVLSSTASKLIGYGYADVCFKLASSATDIYANFSPIPQQTPATALQKTQQVNTETNIGGYGKLNNTYGLAPAIPVEFRIIWTSGEQATLSVALLDGLSSDCLGVLLTNVGEFDSSYTPQLIGDSTIAYQSGGVFKIVKISTSPQLIIQKVSTRLYKFNTISPYNLFDAQTKQLALGSGDYNGRMLYSSAAVPQPAGIPVASVLQAAFSNGIDVGDKLVFIPSVAAANIQVYGIRLPSQLTIVQDYSVDTFIEDVYSFSTLSSGLQSVIPSKEDTLYLIETRLPVAIGGEYEPQTVGYPGATLIIEDLYEGYQPSNELFGAYQVFQLFGQLYLFDGQWIYQATFQNNLVGTPVRLAPADGLTLIAVAPTRAYFLSGFDNSLFQFDGGRTLQKTKRLNNMETIINGVWNVRDNTLLLQTAATLIWIRDDVATKNDKTTAQLTEQLRLYDTTDGIVIGSNVGQWQYPYEPVQGAAVVPLTWTSGFLGMAQNKQGIVKSFVATIKADVGVSGFLILDSFDEDAAYQVRDTFQIKKGDFNSLGYVRFRIQPKNQRALGMQFTLMTNQAVLLQDLTVLYEEDISGVVNPDRSK